MKEITCHNGETLKVDNVVYKKISKYNWRVVYRTGYRPRVVAYIDGKEINIIHLILPCKRWVLANGDDLDYTLDNIIGRLGTHGKDVSLYIDETEHKDWKLRAKARGCSMNDLIRITMHNAR